MQRLRGEGGERDGVQAESRTLFVNVFEPCEKKPKLKFFMPGPSLPLRTCSLPR